MARILVVEDDGALRHDLVDRLEEWGHEVRQATDGFHGFNVIESWTPDLVLSDVNMPKCSGIELVEHLAAPGSAWAGVSFFFMSSASSRSQVFEGIARGAEDYFVKPIDYELLRAKIKINLEKKNALLTEDRTERLNDSLAETMLHGAIYAGIVGALLIVAIMIAYLFKTALGINIFEDVHFYDLLG